MALAPLCHSQVRPHQPAPLSMEAAASLEAPPRRSSDAQGADASSFPPALDPVVSLVRQRMPQAKAIRSLFSVMGIGEAEPFGVPAQAQMLTRMRVNAHYFLANYLLMTLFVFAFLLLFFHPIQLLACVALAYGWYLFLTKEQLVSGHFVIHGKRIGEQELLLVATGSTVVFLLFFILPTIVFSLSLTSLGCSLHALLRNTRLKDDEEYSSPRSSKSRTDNSAEDLV